MAGRVDDFTGESNPPEQGPALRAWNRDVVVHGHIHVAIGGLDDRRQLWGQRHLHLYFCRHCGARPYVTGELEALGGAFYAINLACLDDLTPEEWIASPVFFMDGRHDDYEREAEVTGHL